MKNEFSVLMSVYMKENPLHFEQALESIINQTLQPTEIVIVCDGKLTGELEQVIEYNCNKYPQLFKIIRCKENKGLGNALSMGLLECTYDIVARMDTDDIAVKNRFELQMDYMVHNTNCSILGGQIEEFINNDINNIVGKRNVPINDLEISKFLKSRNPFNHMTVMFRKKDVLNANNYQEFHFLEDYYLWCRMHLKKYKFHNLNETLVYARIGKEMYQRRGGMKYFLSWVNLEKFKLDNKIITINRYYITLIERFIVQVLMPNTIRGLIFQKFSRKKV